MTPARTLRWCAIGAVAMALPLLIAAGTPSLSLQPAPSAERLESHPLLADTDNPNSALLQLLRAPVGDGLEESAEEDFDRMILVLSGRATVTLAGQEDLLSAGSAALVPAGMAASLVVTEGPFEAMLARFRPLPGGKDRAPVVVHAPRLPTYSLQDGKLRVQILLDGESGSAAALSILEADAGASAPPHDHGQSEEMVYLLEGTVEMTLGEREFEAGPRNAFRVPGHAEHRMDVVKGPMVAVQLYLPAGPEQRFKAGQRIEPDAGGE
jgi:quercetin dioxygenase-like cupin family protein